MKPPSLASIAVVALFTLSVFGFTLFVWQSFGGPIPLQPKGYQMHVLYGTDAVQLAPNADVRISGVNVGKVKSVTPRAGKLDTVLDIERKFAPVPSDVRAITRSKTLLGEAFVELTPGSRTAPELPENGTLPVDQVQEAQGLDEVLSAFDEPTRDDFKQFLNGFARAIKGRGTDLNASLGNLGAGSDDLETLVKLLDEQRSDVRGLVQDTGTALQAVGRREGDLRSMVTSGNEVFESTARRNRELAETVRALPPFLRDLRATLALLDTTTTRAAPVLSELRPVASRLKPTIQRAEKLVPQFVPVASELDPLIDSALKGLPRLTATLRTAGPLIDVLRPATRDLVPVGKVLDAFKDLAVNGLAQTAAATQAQTDDQHYLRTLLPLANENIVGYERRPGTNRHNPYIEPGGLAKLGTGGLEAFDCRNVSNPTPIPPLGPGSPPCKVQGPFSLGGVARQFPNVEKAP